MTATTAPRVEEQSPKKRVASGHLSPVVSRKRNRNGVFVEYPRVTNRVSKEEAFAYPEQYFWVFNYPGDSGKNRSKSVPRDRVGEVRRAIAAGRHYLEILEIIGRGR